MLDRRRFLMAILLMPVGAPAGAQEPFALERQRMLNEIDAIMEVAGIETGRTRLSARVRAAVAKVPRHRFVSAALQDSAYANRALPIGEGQTISQPVVVALMTELLDSGPNDRVLEIGTGSGYQAAVLAECVARVYTIEIVRPLGERAAALLKQLGYRNIDSRIGDGYQGWPEEAPFDGIVVTAAPDHVPQPLVEQLKPGGRMVIPVGMRDTEQDLLVVTKDPDGHSLTERTLAVRFVPLVREPRP